VPRISIIRCRALHLYYSTCLWLLRGETGEPSDSRPLAAENRPNTLTSCGPDSPYSLNRSSPTVHTVIITHPSVERCYKERLRPGIASKAARRSLLLTYLEESAMAGSTGSTRPKITPYLVYLIFITTLGPFQFGYHLVRLRRLECYPGGFADTDLIVKSG
jgi:hypothetical protein